MAKEEKMIVEYRSQGGIDIRLTPKMVQDYLIQGRREVVKVEEIVYFMHVCKARRLNPFIKDCYLIKYGNEPAAIITSVDYFRKNARKAPDCRGWKAGIAVMSDGKLQYPEGSLILPDQELIGGWASAQPEGWTEPKFHPINLQTYIKKKKDGTVTRFWAPERQPDMIMKVAECQLLRQLWGEESTGMYAPEEMPSLEDVAHEPLQSDIKKRILSSGVKPEKFEEVGPEPTPKPLKPLPETIRSEQPETKGREVDVKEAIPVEDTFYSLVKTCKIKRADAADYVFEKHQQTDVDMMDIMRIMIKDPKREFEAMTKWIIQKNKAEQAEPGAAPVDKAPKPDISDMVFINEEWDPKIWWRKKTGGFATHVWKHIKTFDGEPNILKNAVKAKWAKLYKDDPFPSKDHEQSPDGNAENSGPPPSWGNSPIDEPLESIDDVPDEIPPTTEPLALNTWLKRNFPEEREGARKYLGFTDTPGTLSKEAVAKWNHSTQQLIDMGNA